MNLKGMDARLTKIAETLKTFTEAQHSCDRDKDANLLVTFHDEVIKLPYVSLRPYQIAEQIKLVFEGIRRFFLVWPRRSGKEVITWASFIIDSAIETPGVYILIYPTNVRAKKVLWTGDITLPGGKSFRFLDMIPKRLILSINNQEMTVTLNNGSIIHVLGSDVDPDKLRGTNPRGVGISEYAYCDPRVLNILLPILRQNGGWLIVQTTFNGMNHAYKLYKEVEHNPSWSCRVESVESLRDENGNRYVTDEMIEEDRKSGMPEYLIQQEYYSVVQHNEETMYFATPMKYLYENERIISDLIIPNYPVYTFWDIGRNDANAIVICQFDSVLHMPHIIGYIEGRNKIPEFYFEEIRRFATRRGLTVRSHFVPHDGEKRDYNSGKNTVDAGYEMGESVIIVPRPHSKIEAINQMRKMLYRCKFNKEHASRLLDCISNYSKVYDEKLGDYKNEPLHDWASHGVDSFQTMTLAIDANMINEKPINVIYNRS